MAVHSAGDFAGWADAAGLIGGAIVAFHLDALPPPSNSALPVADLLFVR
jgi:hypothetical protein